MDEKGSQAGNELESLFNVLRRRRSIRKFTSEPVPETVIERAVDAALLAPNSSNTQTWDFYWVKSESTRQKLIEGCLSQSAARTANQLVVVTADPKKWRRSQKRLLEYAKDVKAPRPVILYYEKLIPLVYQWGFLNTLGLFKWITSNIIGLFRPMMRGPNTKRDLQEVSIKSAALGAENFVLAISAQGYATCMMEGFDECRVKRLLKLPLSARVVMVIGIGREAERGTWGPRYRIPKEEVFHHI